MGPPGKVCPGLPSESDVVVEGDYCGAQVYESTEEDPSRRDHLASKCQLADEREQATLCACPLPSQVQDGPQDLCFPFSCDGGLHVGGIEEDAQECEGSGRAFLLFHLCWSIYGLADLIHLGHVLGTYW